MVPAWGMKYWNQKWLDFTNPARMQTYIDKGRHHLRWQLNDKYQSQHVDLLVLLLSRHPALKSRVKNKLDLFQDEHLKAMMTLCTQYPVNIPLLQVRANFVFDLVNTRFQIIRKKLYNDESY